MKWNKCNRGGNRVGKSTDFYHCGGRKLMKEKYSHTRTDINNCTVMNIRRLWGGEVRDSWKCVYVELDRERPLKRRCPSCCQRPQRWQKRCRDPVKKSHLPVTFSECSLYVVIIGDYELRHSEISSDEIPLSSKGAQPSGIWKGSPRLRAIHRAQNPVWRPYAAIIRTVAKMSAEDEIDINPNDLRIDVTVRVQCKHEAIQRLTAEPTVEEPLKISRKNKERLQWKFLIKAPFWNW